MRPLRYEAIQDLELDYACTTARAVVGTKIVDYVSGMEPEDRARNVEVMSRLIANMVQNAPRTKPPTPTPTPTPPIYYCLNCHRSDPSVGCGSCSNSIFGSILHV